MKLNHKGVDLVVEQWRGGEALLCIHHQDVPIKENIRSTIIAIQKLLKWI